MAHRDPEDDLLRSVALQTASSIRLARQRAEDELHRTREALRESQERLTAALAAAGTGTFRWNIRANTVEWDGNLDRLFGLEPGQAVQSLETFIAAVHHEDRPGVISSFERSARDGSDFDLEFRVAWPDASLHWIHNKAKAFPGADGRPLYLTGACADVTSLKVAAEALRANEERLRAMFNQAAVGIAVAETDGRLVDMNRRFADILGYSPDELRHRTYAEITYDDDLPATQAAVRRLVGGEATDYSLEKRYVRRDGTVVWSLTTVSLLRDEAGRPQRFMGVIEDITARKHTEAALQEETRVLERLNETGRALAATLDLQALLQAVTDAATELSGAAVGAFHCTTTDGGGRPLRLSAFSGAPREAFEAADRPGPAGSIQTDVTGDTPVRSPDVLKDPAWVAGGLPGGLPAGHPPVRSYLAVPVRSPSGERIGGLFLGHPEPGAFSARAERLIVGVAAQAGVAVNNARLYEAARQAAEERKALLESERAARSEAERMSRVKDEFLATLSHELRTPLNAILGWSQLLRSGTRERAELMKGLATIERNARAQTQLIDDLLDMSRIVSGKLRLEVQPVSPVTIIEAAVETVQPAADAKGIRMETLLDPFAGPISGDPNRLQQVVWNLLSNAIKFTPRGGKVQVELSRVNSHIELSVADTGVGIRPDLVAHLFERFRQGDASTTRKYGGLGLGLSIVKSLVELHGGTVQASSPGEGLGTAVTVLLPLSVVRRDRPERGGPGGPSLAGELEDLAVLIVDDQADARDLVRRVLEESGAAVTAAASAAEALSLIQACAPDVLVTDIGMPEADGFELLKRVRALPPERGGRIPAIALTAFARSEDRTRALRAGFLVHVSKPVDPAELVATIASVAGRAGERP